MRFRARQATALMAILASSGCRSGGATPSIPTAANQDTAATTSSFANRISAQPDSGLRGKFRHVVIIVQENRTPDNLFNGLPGADTVRSGRNSKGQTVPLSPVSLAAPYDIQHTHDSFLKEYDGGKMDGFDRVNSGCNGRCPPKHVRAYGYVPHSETQPYFAMATRYAFADRMFQSNQGPSFPAHLYVIAGTSAPSVDSMLRIAENPRLTERRGTTAGCDSPDDTRVKLIDAAGHENRTMYPCLDRPTILDVLGEKHLTWHYYQSHKGAGLWNAVDAIRHIRFGPRYANDVAFPPTLFFSDVSKGTLSDVSVVTPTADNSDHAGITNLTGPAWVAQVVNAIGTSPYWKDTAIFVTWDDWGGWYDHVQPPIYSSDSLGLRVPLIVISPYTPAGYVSHRQHEFGSILKFVEETFGLESLNTTDLRADNLADCFNFKQSPRKFGKIPAPRSAIDFLHGSFSWADPDND
jgi:phospholipase C